MHRLVCIPPSMCTALLVAPEKTSLLRWLQTAFCVHRLQCAPPCVCTGFYVHRLVHARTCMWTARLVSANPPPLRLVGAPIDPPPARLVSAPKPPPRASLAPTPPSPARLVSADPPPVHLLSANPPPPVQTERPFGCGALWAPSSTRAVAPQPVQPAPVAPRAGKHSLRPGAPPPARGTPSAVGSRTQPAWQHHLCLRQSRSAGLTPVVPRTTAFPCQQAVVEWLGSMS